MQRRKGNAQCANSSKAAEMLQNAGNFVPFLGVEGLQISSIEEVDISTGEFDSVAPEIRVTFKKLSKRDAMTRQKGIKEIAEIIENVSRTELKPIFTYFSAAYSRLVTDSVANIRSLTNSALSSFLKILRKEAEGSALKTVMPFLLFSLGDAHTATKRSAERLLDECFPNDKHKILIRGFSKPALNLAIEIANRKHKLVQPQLTAASDETDDQRQSRLISQALATMKLLLDEDAQLAALLTENFIQPATITSLTKISMNIKVSLFSLLRRLIEIDANPFIDQKIVALILTNLNSDNLSLCRNAFACFLALAADERFCTACKFEKAVVPKFLSIIRRKSTYWSELEIFLPPAFERVCVSLASEARDSWIRAAITSFFDGGLPTFLLPQWSTTFVAVVRYSMDTCYENAEMLAFLRSMVIKFVEFVSACLPNDEKLQRLVAGFIMYASQLGEDNEEFKLQLCQLVVDEPSRAQALGAVLLSQWDDRLFLKTLLNFDKITDELLLQALRKDVEFAVTSVPNVGDFLLRRICDSLPQYRTPLLQILCELTATGQVENLLPAFVKNDSSNYHLFTFIDPSLVCRLFDGSTRADMAQHIIDVVLAGTIKYEWNRDVFEWLVALDELSGARDDERIFEPVMEKCLTSEQCSEFVVELYAKFHGAGKVDKDSENRIAFRLFKFLLTSETGLLHGHEVSGRSDILSIVELLARLSIDLPTVRADFQRWFADDKVDFGSVMKLASIFENLKFANVSVLDFHPTASELEIVAEKFEQQFLLDILRLDESFFFSFIPARPSLFAALPSANAANDVFTYLGQCAKQALFLHKSIASDALPPASRAFIWLAATFVEFFCSTTFSMEHRDLLAEYAAELNQVEVNEDSLVDILKLFLPSDEKAGQTEISLPISLIFALRMRDLSDGGAKLNDFLKCTVVRYCSSPVFALNFSGFDAAISIYAGLTSTGDDTARLQGWIYEFERACATFNPENRATHFFQLAAFVELTEFNEWLFTLTTNNAARDTLSCVVLRFFAKVAPYMAEVDGPLRDFINCGFVTAFQSCTDTILALKSEQMSSNPLLFVLARLCLRLFVVYENCVMLNAENAHYADIKQEWDEFFSPSAVNFVVSLFLKLSQDDNIYPSGFTLELCRLVHFIDARRLFGAEVLKAVSFESDSEDEFQTYPSPRRDVLRATKSLMLSNKVEVQLAAGKMLQSNLTFMFEHENVPTSTSIDIGEGSNDATPDLSDCFYVDDTQTRIPKFLANALLGNGCGKTLPDGQPMVERRPVPVELVAWEAFVRFIAGDSVDASTRVLICDAFSTRVVDTALERLLASLPDPPPSPSAKGADIFVTDSDPYRITVFDYEWFLCNLYYRSLTGVPVLVRQWYLSLGKSVALAINRYTRKYVSTSVLHHEISRIGGAAMQHFGRLDIKVLNTVNEVVAGYRFDDTTISLHIALPEDFPLSLATITTQRKIVNEHLHRRWLLQLEKFLSHENGSLLDGIMQWKRNIDKHLEGVDDCTICMLTVSLTNHQLPRIRCRQCRNKFHGDCLYKWFKTSSNTSCPLCRSNFVR